MLIPCKTTIHSSCEIKQPPTVRKKKAHMSAATNLNRSATREDQPPTSQSIADTSRDNRKTPASITPPPPSVADAPEGAIPTVLVPVPEPAPFSLPGEEAAEMVSGMFSTPVAPPDTRALFDPTTAFEAAQWSRMRASRRATSRLMPTDIATPYVKKLRVFFSWDERLGGGGYIGRTGGG